ncbi:MAG: dephospho-CoA kinase [Lachnospiraceae bacterium]|nr:dephospho-CoA kinase [Lachnospiraceae bacterium]MBO4461963.1 dephospho-CoA kinase [Lachnospiraceae bacterium]
MIILGITGGVGAGKSEVLKYMEDAYKAVIIKADELAANLMMPGNAAYEGIKSILPQDVLREDGTIDNKKLAAVFFKDANLKNSVNSVVFPLVKEAISDIIEAACKSATKLLVLEAALLIEEHYDEICDELWYVYAEEDIRAERLRLSRGYSDERIKAVMASQLSNEEFIAGTKVIIDNSGSFEDTKTAIDKELYRLGVKRWEQ